MTALARIIITHKFTPVVPMHATLGDSWTAIIDLAVAFARKYIIIMLKLMLANKTAPLMAYVASHIIISIASDEWPLNFDECLCM